MAQFPSASHPAAQARMPAPHEPSTFERCASSTSAERETNATTYRLFEDLLRLRRDPTFAAQDPGTLHGAVPDDGAFVLPFGTGTGEDRLVVVSLRGALDAAPPRSRSSLRSKGRPLARRVHDGRPAIRRLSATLRRRRTHPILGGSAVVPHRSRRDEPSRTHDLPDRSCKLEELVDRSGSSRTGAAATRRARSGVPTRRFHGLLVAALPPPIGRALMLSEVTETVRRSTARGRPPRRLASASAIRNELDTAKVLESMRPRAGCRVGPIASGHFVLEKRIHLVSSENTAIVRWRLIEARRGRARHLVPRLRHVPPARGPGAGPRREPVPVRGEGGEHEVHGPAPFPPPA